MKTPLFRLAALALVFAAACASRQTELEEDSLGETPNVHRYGGIVLAGQPSAEDLAAAKARGVETVVNLRKDGEPIGYDEEQAARELGLEYIAFPWAGPDELTDDVFDRGRMLLEGADDSLLLHCGSANRVGALWLPWRVLDGGLDYDAALAEAKEIGLRNPDYEAKAAEYIRARQEK